MNLRIRVFRSKVARRVFILFVLAALIPVCATALITLKHIAGALTETAQQQLRDSSRAYGQLVYRRLVFADGALSRVALDPGQFAATDHRPPELAAVAMISRGRVTPLFGEMSLDTPNASLAARSSLVLAGESDPPGIVIVRPMEKPGDYIAGQVAGDYIWDDETLPFGLELCVLNADTTRALYCSSNELRERALAGVNNRTSGDFTWENEAGRQLASYWELFVQSGFSGESWVVIASQSEAIALASLISFNQVFPPIFLLSFVTIVLLSIWQIRRSMFPLDQLVQGTRRIADQDFETPLRLDSGDEFGDLADAMNDMAARLGMQFKALNTLGQIDHLILSAEGLEQVIETVLNQARSIIACDGAAMMLLDPDTPDLGHLYVVDYMSETEGATLRRVPVMSVDRDTLNAHPRGAFFDSNDVPFLSSLEAMGLPFSLVFPVLRGGTLSGALVFGFHESKAIPGEIQEVALDLTDRLAVALSATEREAELFERAHFDTLTGLPNRQLCYDRLRQAVAQARRDEHQLALLFLDLDGFKTINDSLGHTTGDQLLREAASRLTACMRDTDTVARIGGDEFVIILPRVIGAPEIEAVTENVMNSLARPYSIGGEEVFVTASIGVTRFPSDGDSVEELLRKADAAMYDAKGAGRARYVFFTNEIDERAVERLALETDLRHALNRGELSLRFQPQLDLKTDQTACAEALLRWTHPRRGTVSPELFVPILEDMGMIDQVGLWVLRTAVKQLRQWRTDGLPIERIGVNVSAKQFKQQNFVEQVQQVLEETGVPGSCLELELTESAVVEDMTQSNRCLSELRDLAVNVAIDDFGTGYSSFSYLKNLQFDCVKIDRAFVRELPDSRAVAIAKAIIAVGHTLDKTVIAEGVENDVQLERLKELGCDLAQGFLISRPLEAADFAHWLEKTTAGEDLSPSFVARALA